MNKFGEYDHDSDYKVSLDEYLKQLGQAALLEQNKQRFEYCDEDHDDYLGRSFITSRAITTVIFELSLV